MGVLSRMVEGDYEQVVHCHDARTGLRAIIAVHSTALGPGLGGTRFYPYPDEEAALTDVMRLSRAMTYKAAAAGLDLGGGKAVIIGDPGRDKTEPLLRAYAGFVESLGGRYLTAEDVGTTQADMDLLREETKWVTGTTAGSGDPSEATAYGVRAAIHAVTDANHVVVAGVGKVGSTLARLLVEDGARVTIADTDPGKVSALGLPSVPAHEAHRVPCDVFSPCALGGVINESSIPELACRAVVGAANNQLATPADAATLAARGITLAPDFVVNAGGIINIAEELTPEGYERVRALERVEAIATTVRAVIAEAAAERITTVEAAERMAERRIAAARLSRS